MNKENFEKKHPGLKEEMMMEESIASADLAKQESIRIDIQDIKSVLSMLEGGTERKEIINFFKEYIYAEKPKEFEQVIWNCALRYALGRRSYITGVVGDFIMDRVDELTPTTKSIMIRDIEEADDLGHGCDKKTWLKLFNELKQ